MAELLIIYLLAGGEVYVESVNGFLYVVNSSPLKDTSVLDARFRPDTPTCTRNAAETKVNCKKIPEQTSNNLIIPIKADSEVIHFLTSSSHMHHRTHNTHTTV